MTPTVLLVSPHPDDEVLGAGGALRLLRMYDCGIHNLACSLGRPDDRARRQAELLTAAARIEFYTTIMDPPAEISSGNDLRESACKIAAKVSEMITVTGADVVVSPHPYDGHHGHEAVASGVRAALAGLGDSAPRWWMWGLWSDLQIPTIYAPFGHIIMNEVQHAIAAYTGENARNQYDRLYPARAAAHAVLGAERVFGYGATNTSNEPFADLLTEVYYRKGQWLLGQPRVLDPRTPTPAAETDQMENVSWWVHGKSVTETRRSVV